MHVYVALDSDELSSRINAKYIFLYCSYTTVRFLLIPLMKTVFDTLKDIMQM